MERVFSNNFILNVPVADAKVTNQVKGQSTVEQYSVLKTTKIIRVTFQ